MHILIMNIIVIFEYVCLYIGVYTQIYIVRSGNNKQLFICDVEKSKEVVL